MGKIGIDVRIREVIWEFQRGEAQLLTQSGIESLVVPYDENPYGENECRAD